MVAVYSNSEEVIVFEINSEGIHVGVEEYFNDETGRDKEDYNIEAGDLPLHITPRIHLNTCLEKVLV